MSAFTNEKECTIIVTQSDICYTNIATWYRK